MEILVRYKNGSLYSRHARRFVNLDYVRKLHYDGRGFKVVQAKTNDNVTSEVVIMALIEMVKERNIWDRVRLRIMNE